MDIILQVRRPAVTRLRREAGRQRNNRPSAAWSSAYGPSQKYSPAPRFTSRCRRSLPPTPHHKPTCNFSPPSGGIPVESPARPSRTQNTRTGTAGRKNMRFSKQTIAVLVGLALTTQFSHRPGPATCPGHAGPRARPECSGGFGGHRRVIASWNCNRGYRYAC